MSRTQVRGQSRGYGAAKGVYTALAWLLWLLKVLVMGAGEALVALYKQLKLLALTLTPGHEYELESDRAGRAAEMRVAALWVCVPPSFLRTHNLPVTVVSVTRSLEFGFVSVGSDFKRTLYLLRQFTVIALYVMFQIS